jgi:GNAT superfamily N-acetyltransferase
MIHITELQSEAEFHEAFPVVAQLRPHLSEARFLELTAEMVWDGYRLFALREFGQIRAVAGVGVRLNLYHGRHLWVYELATDADHRSRGFGEALLRHLEGVARAEGCERVALCSGVQRLDAHRFYEERLGYERVSHVFTRELSE